MKRRHAHTQGMIKAAALIMALSPLAVHADSDLEKLLERKTDGVAAQSQNGLVEAIRQMIPRTSPEQNIFLRHIEGGEYDKALLQFSSAFGGTQFERTESGKAILSYLMFKSGLPVTGVEKLFSAVQSPKQLHLQVLSLWRDAVPSSHPVWNSARIVWDEKWRELFGSAVEVKVRTRDVTPSRGVSALKQLAQVAPAGSQERAIVDWNLAIALSLQDQSGEAAKVIAQLLGQKSAPVSEDLMNITAARLLFQNGYMDAALKYYGKVGKASDYWAEAQEEMGWAYLRKGQPQDAIATTQSLMVPALKGWVGPEALFVRSVAQLRVCDYPEVMKTLVDFKSRYKQRAIDLLTLAENPETELVSEVFKRMVAEDLQWQNLGSKAQTLPRATVRDLRLLHLVRSADFLEAESKSANDLFVKSLAQTGLQGTFDAIKKKADERSRSARVAARNRLAELARVEVEQTKRVLDKLHIVEAEVIQQVASAQRLSDVKVASTDVKVGTTGSKAQDTLRFPLGAEVWFDELSHFKVDVKKGCQAKR